MSSGLENNQLGLGEFGEELQRHGPLPPEAIQTKSARVSQAELANYHLTVNLHGFPETKRSSKGQNMLCIVIALLDKWATVIQGKVIGTSKHKDYSLFHFKAHDVKTLKLPLTKFVFVDAKGEVDEVIEAEQLKDRGVNYKTAKRNADDLLPEEQAEVYVALMLVNAAPATPNPTKAGNVKAEARAAEAQPAETAPAELQPVAAQAEAQRSEALPLDAPVEVPPDEAPPVQQAAALPADVHRAGVLPAEVQPDEVQPVEAAAPVAPDDDAGPEAAPHDDAEPDDGTADDVDRTDDPLDTVKRSRKKKRR